MGTVTIDFSTYSVEDPLSNGGDWVAWTSQSGGEPRIVTDTTNKLFNDEAQNCGRMLSTSFATFNDKQYAEVVIDSITEAYCITPAVRCSDAGNNGDGYALYIRNFASFDSQNRFYRFDNGTPTDLGWMGNGVSAISNGDTVGLLVDGTTLTWYYNPSTYDGDGFPTNGAENTATDSTYSSGQVGVYSDNISTSPGTYVSDFYAAGTTGGASNNLSMGGIILNP